jgi:hypothetical protein
MFEISFRLGISMARPKSSLIGFADLVVSLHNNRKIQRNREEQIRTNDELNNQNYLISNLNEQTSMISNQIENLGELQYATAVGVRDVLSSLTQTLSGLEGIHAELEVLSKGSWEMMNFLQEVERREDVLGALRIFLIDVEEEVDNISLLSKDFLVFSFLMAEDLKSLFDSKNVTINHFKRMPSIDDLKWAKKVIRSVDDLHISLGKKVAMNKLATETYSRLKISLIDVSKLEHELDTLIDKLKQIEGLPMQSKYDFELAPLKGRMEQLLDSKSKFTHENSKFIEISRKLDSEIDKNKRLYKDKIEHARSGPTWSTEFLEGTTDYVKTANLVNKPKQLEIELSEKIQVFENERKAAKAEISKLGKAIADIPNLAKKISDIESEAAKELEEISSKKALIPELGTKILMLEQKISTEWDFIRNLLPPAGSYVGDLMEEKVKFFNPHNEN